VIRRASIVKEAFRELQVKALLPPTL